MNGRVLRFSSLARPKAKERKEEKKQASHIDVPQEINATYTDDYNICLVHEIITKYLEQLRDSIPAMKKEIEALRKEVPTTVVKRKSIEDKCKQLEEKIAFASTALTRYQDEVKSIIEEYAGLDSVSKDTSAEDMNRRITLIESYIDVAQKYYPLNVTRVAVRPVTCECGTDIKHLPLDGSGAQKCNRCQFEISVDDVYDTSVVTEDDSVSVEVSKDRANFIKAIQNFQGLIEVKNFPEVCRRLDAYFSSVGLPTREDAKKLPYDEWNAKVGTSTAMMINALKNTGLSELYPQIAYIRTHYWGWKPHNISHLEQKLMENYDKIQRVYERKKKMKAAMNVNYHLYRQLQHLGYKVPLSHFKIPTGAALDELESIYSSCYFEVYGRYPDPLGP